MLRRAVFLAGLLLPALAACAAPADRSPGALAPDTLVVFQAASLTVPMRAVLDSFSRIPPGAVVREEHGASLELARRITELGRIPDVVLLADQEVFPQLLVPGAASWYARFARNRMVVAYTDRSAHASEMSPEGWRRIVLRDDVLLGRVDPELAPAGYRALLVYRLAERHYGEPGLAARLERRTPPRQLRGNAAELAALLTAGELDYIIEYESLARAQRLRWVALPPEIDLGDQTRALGYARDSVRVRRGADSVTLAGAPILYGASVPRAAPHRAAGERFMAFLAGPAARALLRRGAVDALDAMEVVGDSVPPALAALARPAGPARPARP